MKGHVKTHHRLIFGDSENMRELDDGSIHLVVTSPPYFNAPFDYPGLLSDLSGVNPQHR